MPLTAVPLTAVPLPAVSALPLVAALASAREEPLQAGLQGLLPAPPRKLPRVAALVSAREEPRMPKRAFHARHVVVIAATVDKLALRAARA